MLYLAVNNRICIFHSTVLKWLHNHFNMKHFIELYLDLSPVSLTRVSMTNDRPFLATGEPVQAPDHHSEGRALQPPAGHPRVHVRRRGERGPGPAARPPQHRRQAQGQGTH